MPAGYSGTPLAKKLGIKPSFTVFLHEQPDHYFDLFTDLPASIQLQKSKPELESIDFVHAFFTSSTAVKDTIPQLKSYLKRDGLFWISWPKGSSKIKTDLKRDWIREFVLDIGLVDVKVAAIDEQWSGLKFVYRVEDR